VDETAELIPDRALKARAVTAVSPLRAPGLWIYLRALFWVAPRWMPFLAAPLAKLGFIHVGRWSVVRGVPSPDRPGRRDRPGHGVLVFETSFDGAWRPYIEAFARVMPMQWRGIWGTTRHFPGPLPASELLAHIETIDREPAHYYAAFPRDSLRAMDAALQLDARLQRFARETEDHDDDRFAAELSELASEVQLWL
jgi:hypothetical protein